MSRGGCGGDSPGFFFGSITSLALPFPFFLLAERGRAIAVAVVGTMWNLNAHDID